MLSKNIPKETYTILCEAVHGVAEHQQTLKLLDFLIRTNTCTQEAMRHFTCDQIKRLALTGVPSLIQEGKLKLEEALKLTSEEELMTIFAPGILELIDKNLTKLQDMVAWVRAIHSQYRAQGQLLEMVKQRFFHNFMHPEFYNIIIEYIELKKLTIREALPLQKLENIHIRAFTNPKVKKLIVTGRQNFMIVLDNPEGALNGIIILNQPQSTHKVSVHASATESARKLNSLYGSCIEEQGIFEFHKNEIYYHVISLQNDPEIMAACIQSLPGNAHLTEQKLGDKVKLETLKIAAAQRCIEGFNSYQLSYRDEASKAFDYKASRWSYEDPNSKITNGKLLLLFWVAIHDDFERDKNATLTDGQRQFVEALYEIQRAGNIDGKTGLDNCAEDAPPYCPSGTFNKIIEKLVSIHPAAEIQVKTLETFNIALPTIVREEAVKFLKKNHGYKKRVRDGDITVIWIHIVNDIRNMLREEYGNLADFSAAKSNGKSTFEEAVDWEKRWSLLKKIGQK